MTFKQLSEYFEKLESTSSRLSLIDILSKLFKKAGAEEIPIISYLLQGRVAPFYEPIEIGMAEKSVAKAMSRVYGKPLEDITKMYGKVGDLGSVAADLAGNKKSKDQSIKEIFDSLLKIAKFSGDGTVENKISALTNLLEKSSGIEAKHLVRVPLGTSRLGIGDPTILDAFALTKLGDKSKRKLLEGAYNKVSDLGLIGQTLWKDGLKGVEKLDVTVGRPIRSQLAERLPNAEAIIKKFDGSAHVQKKFDGFRVQIHKDGDNIRLFSRNLEETTPMFPDIIKGVISQVKAKTAILDSEALAFNPQSEEFLPFQETTQRRRKHGIEEAVKRLPLKAMVFDVMFLNGSSLMDEPVSERIKVLEKVIDGNEVLIAEPGEITDKPERIQALFDEAISEGLEGLIVKRPDSKYEAGARNFNWVKQKRHSAGELKDTVDCVILGYIFGRGKRAEFGAGALLVGVYDKDKDEFVTVSKIGTGLTDEEWREIHKRADKIKVNKKPARINSIMTPSVWIAPEIVIEILADEITRSPTHTAGKDETGVGYALRFPRLVKFREKDKQAEDATTVKELKEMYKLQFKK
ncbi:DNA ligase [Candidatus Daviesbacteria bacterium RIFCSPHIGHO2_12_FULL_37_16]|uniref:Probable DNA ligase n=3 Tax=Candidatus Daviesiibacteriota TaxID=1752718 RepID=A0A0G0I2X6_9BACT|nr:MAG: putative DNA ligase [Candidatus Daviesbacteria bacterium GW2011_GWB1_36_5]KKQ16198.1 MAG: putative DNA ligase [Candidatus Daviesbacteria bacterium GW2011_GWA1_36_8]OGE33271.1 MAG: DNA ligase [Candidatus Daviesbacteria bacterium RIFCSPHIGHO2_02_FULL_37_9]OGE36173.1 MAG: DNA ligase [Candidatus Daviesbacteria bacterium RIFCSPHIGHO2_12_FULL_37_16]